MIDEIKRLCDRLIAEITDIDSPHGHRKADRRKALSMTGVAGDCAHIGFYFLFNPVALAFAETPLKVVDNPLKLGFIDAAAIFVAALNLYFLTFRTIEKDINDFRRQLPDRRIKGKMIVFGKCRHIHGGNRAALHGPSARLQTAFMNGKGFVRHNQVGINFHKYAQSGTLGARTKRIVKGKHAWGQFFHTDSMFRAGIIL